MGPTLHMLHLYFCSVDRICIQIERVIWCSEQKTECICCTQSTEDVLRVFKRVILMICLDFCALCCENGTKVIEKIYVQ